MMESQTALDGCKMIQALTLIFILNTLYEKNNMITIYHINKCY